MMMNTGQQSESSNSSVFIRFCWLRETAPGRLEPDGGIRIPKADLVLALLGLHTTQQRTGVEPAVSLSAVLSALNGTLPVVALPSWAGRRLAVSLGPLTTVDQRCIAAANLAILRELAGRILKALPATGECEVHLPYMDRRNWLARFDVLAQTEFVCRSGRILPAALDDDRCMLEYTARLLAIASAYPGITAGLACNTSAAPDLQLTLSSTACRAWHDAPKENSAAYFTAHAPVSIAVQTALRRWLASYWLSDPRKLARVDDTSTVLAYFASRPFPGRRRTDFTYDPLTTDWFDFAFRFARRPLHTLLDRVHRALEAAGSPVLAAVYHPSQDVAIIGKVRKERKSLRSLAAAESQILDHLLKFGFQLRSLDDPLTASHLAPAFAEGLASRLHHFFREQDLTWIGPILLMEATNALWTALGGNPALQTSMHKRHTVAAPSMPDFIVPACGPAPAQSPLAPLPC